MDNAISVSVTPKNMKFTKYEVRAEANLLEALDVVAAEVQEHARSGHPKLSPLTIRRVRGDRDVIDSYRERTQGNVGEFKGMLRWLTRTGATRLSIQIEKAHVIGSGFSRSLRASVFSAQKHINDLEFGTVKKRAFPTFRPALISKMNRGNYLMRQAMLNAAAGL